MALQARHPTAVAALDRQLAQAQSSNVMTYPTGAESLAGESTRAESLARRPTVAELLVVQAIQVESLVR